MYPEAETFNDGMVAEVVSREHRSGYGQEHRTDRVKPDDLEDDDEFTDDGRFPLPKSPVIFETFH